jgi:UDP-N-acetylmuramoyl-L-alanyl-D-glutamate--2,6-diaminopimelate ligase
MQAQSSNLTKVSDVMGALDRLGVARQRLTVDSRLIEPGDVFVAIPGAKTDGRNFIPLAFERGAAAILCETGHPVAHNDARVINVDNLSAVLGEIANEFYDRPSQALRVFGITGTNGKTSIANWLAQAFSALGVPCGAMGTLGVSLGDKTWSTSNTTPDAAHVHTILRDLHQSGARAVAMEVSSHALELHRVVGVRFDAVIFTNLTQDHLDFHGSMQAYGAAKQKLFTDYPAKLRVINADDEFGVQLLKKGFANTVSYGLREGDVRGEVTSMNAGGMTLAISYYGRTTRFSTPLIGRFNAYNLLAVATVLVASNVALNDVGVLLSKLDAAPGRMQRVNSTSVVPEPIIYVDYAHTPDALAKALDTVLETKPHALAVVFGCGGDRDRSKRPLMGAIAADRADHVYLTSDNPRSEQPEKIIEEVAAGVDAALQSKLNTIPARRDAIRFAINSAAADDVVLIAGKGHETYQEVRGVRYEFSDVEEAREALLARRNSANPSSMGIQHVVG